MRQLRPQAQLSRGKQLGSGAACAQCQDAIDMVTLDQAIRDLPLSGRAPPTLKARWLPARVALLVAMLVPIVACMEVEETYNYDRSGIAQAKVVLKIDPQYEAALLPDLEGKLRQNTPEGITIDSTQRIDGKAALIVTAGSAAAATQLISDANRSSEFKASDAGFLKQRYEYRLRVIKRPDLPIPHKVRVTLPGSIERTNGLKMTDDTVEFDLTNARRGAVFSVTSTGFAFAFPGGKSTSASLGAAATSPPPASAWLLPMSSVAIVAGALLLVAGWFAGRKRKLSEGVTPSDDASAITPPIATEADAPPQRQVFCSECGSGQAAMRKFCSNCGAGLA